MTTTTDTTTKQCTHCHKVKPVDQFNPRHQRPGDYHPWCKSCLNQADREKRQRRAEADAVVLDLPVPPKRWREQAACAGQDVDLWFAEGVGPAEQACARYAKSICASCPVRRPCGLFALGWPGSLPGIYGGLTEEDRRAIKRAEKAKRDATT